MQIMKAIKQISFVVLALAYLTAPLTVLAQKDDKDKVKEKKEAEQIIITRKNSSDEKTVIEINGDKVTVNGKPVDEKDGDVTVRRHKIKDTWTLSAPDGFGSWNENYSMSTMDENRAMLGVTTEKDAKGVEIQTISKDGGAEKAGLKKGDIITKIDNDKIEDPDDLSKSVRAHKPGDKVSVTYLRDGKEQKVTAELGKWKGVKAYTVPGQAYGYTPDMEMPRIQALPRTRIRGQSGDFFSWNWSGGSSKLGMSVQDTDDGKGVKVLEVDEEGTASKAGIKEDDIITEVDGKAVNGADEIAKIMKESKDKVSVKVKLLRGGKTENLEVKIPRKLKTADL
jgi:serine protease Do